MKKLNRTSKFHLSDGTAQVTVDENELNELEAALAEAVELLRGLWVTDSDGVEGVAIRAFLRKHGGEGA